jgi:hypothetical protein
MITEDELKKLRELVDAGDKLPRPNWVPNHIAIEISNRWQD